MDPLFIVLIKSTVGLNQLRCETKKIIVNNAYYYKT